MVAVYVIDNDRRLNPNRRLNVTKVAQEKRNKSSDRRSGNNSCISIEKWEHYLDFLKDRSSTIIDFIKDKEKKKLAIVLSSFAVFSLLTKATVDAYSKVASTPEVLLTAQAISLITLFVIALALIYTSIIKYIVALKAEEMLGTRQLNCLRQATNSCIYAGIEGKFPKSLTESNYQNKDFASTVLEDNTSYWEIYGVHEKYPLQNYSLRDQYKKVKSIFFRSADLYAVVIIAIFANVLTISPILYISFNVAKETIKLNSAQALSLGAVCIFVAASSSYLVYRTLRTSYERIMKILGTPQPYCYGPDC